MPPRRSAATTMLVAGLAAAVSQMAGAAPLRDTDRERVERFLATQAEGAPGTVTARIDGAAAALPECPQLEPFLPAGAKAWGRVSVGIRCTGDRPWTRYLPATVSVQGQYLVAAHPIAAGAPLARGDYELRTGELTAMPKAVVTDPVQVQGMVAANSIAAGAPLRADVLRGAIVVRQGQTVRVVAAGAGFVASTQGQVLTKAAAGDLVQVKTADGRVLSGTARADGSITVGH